MIAYLQKPQSGYSLEFTGQLKERISSFAARIEPPDWEALSWQEKHAFLGECQRGLWQFIDPDQLLFEVVRTERYAYGRHPTPEGRLSPDANFYDDTGFITETILKNGQRLERMTPDGIRALFADAIASKVERRGYDGRYLRETDDVCIDLVRQITSGYHYDPEPDETAGPASQRDRQYLSAKEVRVVEDIWAAAFGTEWGVRRFGPELEVEKRVGWTMVSVAPVRSFATDIKTAFHENAHRVQYLCHEAQKAGHPVPLGFTRSDGVITERSRQSYRPWWENRAGYESDPTEIQAREVASAGLSALRHI